jgi:hypothetical protein
MNNTEKLITALIIKEAAGNLLKGYTMKGQGFAGLAAGRGLANRKPKVTPEVSGVTSAMTGMAGPVIANKLNTPAAKTTLKNVAAGRGLVGPTVADTLGKK